MAGPLSGIRIVELAGLGPVPFAGMMLGDHGAEVIRVDRPGASFNNKDPLLRSRKSVVLDLKSEDGKQALRDLIAGADALMEGFRPGVMDRLGFGPDEMLALNPKLVYARMTGWGQDGPWASMAGHDINYIALSGALHPIGRAGERPVPPLNLVGDFGGGAMMLCFSLVSALLNVRSGGEGQVIDCAMTDGSALLTNMMWGFRAFDRWEDERGVNLLDSGAPFYDTYETADGKYLSLGPIEPQFYARFCELAGIADDPAFAVQNDRSRWPEQKKAMAKVIAGRTRDEWAEIMVESDACVAPVLDWTEAPAHPHNVARGTFLELDGVMQAAPAPRYSRTTLDRPNPPREPGSDQSLLQEASRK